MVKTVLLGMGLMYLFDPVNGRRRRAELGNRLDHARRVELALAGKAGRDLSHRARGLVERLRHPQSADVDDAVLEGRVRSRVGRAVSHPGAIGIEVHEGSVLLYGPVLAHEHRALIKAVQSVKGVCQLVDRLDPHVDAGHEPSLQGEGKVHARRDVWPPSTRALAIGAGGALALWGLLRGRFTGKIAALAGGALALRGTANEPLPALLGFGHPRAIDIQKSIFVDAPIDAVFALWSRLDQFPRFMQHVREVCLMDDDPRLSHWTVDGPAGVPIRFDSELTDYVTNRSVGWRTLPGQAIEHHGIVHFEPEGSGTRVHIRLCYQPPLGKAGHAVARLLGWDPKKRLDEDLLRMKALLEQGYTRAHGHRIFVEQIR